ncbi:MAG: YfhO family protein [Ekhidna sp.]|nr:YfhO family protein [Ekhidna sp.]MBC6410111.1 YfhO family protein [Ekhidna sp.]
MTEQFKKNLLTHGLIIFGFFIVTVFVHYPTFLSGERINQHDILQGFGGNQQLREYRAKTGDEALWNPNMFSGMPAYLTGVSYPGDLLSYAYKIIGLGMSHPPAILFISLVSFYVLLLSYKVRPLIAAAGAIAFGLNGFNIISIVAGHNAKIAAVALMPLVLAGINLTFSDKKWLGLGLTALALGLQIRTNHLQITYYLLLIVTGYGINQLILAFKEKNLKSFAVKSGLLVVVATLAFGANYGRLATILAYSKYSIRGKSELSADQSASSGLDREYAFRYSNGITEPLFLFVPNIFGGSSQQALSSKSEIASALKAAGYNRTQINQQIRAVPTYWREQPLTAPYYAGTFTVIFFVLGILILPRNQKAWLIALVVLGIMLSWGKNFSSFNYFLFDYLPGYNKFRSVTFTIIISIFCMNLMGFIGLERLFNSEWNKDVQKKVLLALSICGGFLVLLLIFSGTFTFKGTIDAGLPDWYTEALKKDRKSLLTGDTLRTLMYLLSLVGLIWAAFRKNVKTSQILTGLIILIFVDSFSLSKRFLGEEQFDKDIVENHFKATQADQVLIQATGIGDRVLNLQNPFNENRTSYYHASIGGYHGAKIRRYQDLIDYCLGSEVQEAIQQLQSQSLDFSSLHVLNMLNTAYFYAGKQQNGVFPNQFANGAAWTVNEVKGVNSPEEEISALCRINTKMQAVIDQSKFELPAGNGSGTITLHKKTPNKLTYSADISEGEAFAVFSEIYYPEGWKAYINGEETEILRANYVLRTLSIPEGKHEIVFEFKPKVYANGNMIMLIGSFLILGGFIGILFVELKAN